jgi:hypothetical protein
LPRGLFLWRNLRDGGACFFRKDLASESEKFDACIAPGIQRQMRFAAGFLKESLGTEAVLDGNLREQQAALISPRNQQAVAADLDFAGTNRGGWGEQRNFDLQNGYFVGADRGESRVLRSSADGATNDTVAQGLVRFGYTNTATQAMADAKSDENAAALGKNPIDGNLLRKNLLRNGFNDRVAREAQQGPPVGLREERHPRSSCGLPSNAASSAA